MGSTSEYTYDYRNRLTEVQQVSGSVTTTVAQYTYDALNRPIEVVEGGSTRYTLYDGQTPLLDFNAAGTVTARYLSVSGAIDELLARQTSVGAAWYLTDREGSVNDIINNSGMDIDHIDYSVFGIVLDESNSSNGDRFAYADMKYDQAVGLNYDRSRWYDSGTGTFTSQDPSGFYGEDDNLYRYSGGSPSNLFDPSGLDDKPPVINFPVPAPSLPPGSIVVHGPTVSPHPPLTTIIPPTGNTLRNPDIFPEVTNACNALEALSKKDLFERAVGVYLDAQGNVFIGIPNLKNGTIVNNNYGGQGGERSFDTVEFGALYTPPPGFILIAVIHTHPPNPDPTTKNPQNSPRDPVNCDSPFGTSPRVPWLVIDSDGKIWLIGPDIRGGTPNPVAR